MNKYFTGTVIAVIVSLIATFAPAQATTYTIFGDFPIITTTVGVGTLTIVPPTSNSPGAWSYTSSNPTVATVTGGVLNILSVGSSTITATQAASGDYTSRSRSTPLRVNPGTPTLGNFPAQSVSITQQTFTLTPPASNSTGSWSYSSSNSLIASIVGNKVSLLDGGSVVITATQGPTLNWHSASAQMTLTIIAVDPKIGTFGNITLMKDSVGSLTLVAPTSLSPGAWSFTSSNLDVATIYGTTLTLVGMGTSTITAAQAHSGNYSSAKTSMTLTVLGSVPTVGPFPNDTVAYTSTSPKSFILVAPTSNSPGAWTFTSSDTTVATVSGATVIMFKPGSVVITASQAASGTYGPISALMTLTVVGAPTIGIWSDIQKVVKDPDFTLTPPTSTSTGAWTYTSSDPNVIDVNGAIVKVAGAGQATITATQTATPIWSQAIAQITIQVAGNIPTLGSFTPILGAVGEAPVAIKPPTSNSKGVWTFVSSNLNVATIRGNLISIVGVGTATITATQGAAGDYSQSNTVQTTVTGTPKVTPTPTSTAKPTPTPTVKPVPTAKPTPTLTPKPTPTPTAKPPVNATIKVTAVKRVITVVAIGVKALVFINGKPGKVGKNTVKPGKASVVITIKDKVVYRKNFTIK